MNTLKDDIKTVQCSICEKEIIYSPEWRFKRNTRNGRKTFCSWSCLRKHESRRKKSGPKTKKVSE